MKLTYLIRVDILIIVADVKYLFYKKYFLKQLTSKKTSDNI